MTKNLMSFEDYIKLGHDDSSLITDRHVNLLTPLWMVSYDINTDSSKRILDKIHEFGHWVDLSSSVYLIESDMQFKDICLHFGDVLNEGDLFSVSPFQAPFYGKYSTKNLEFLNHRFQKSMGNTAL